MRLIDNPDYCRAVLRAAERGTGLRFYHRTTHTLKTLKVGPLSERPALHPDDPLPPIKTDVETKVEFGDFTGPPGTNETILSAAEVKAEEPDCWAALQG